MARTLKRGSQGHFLLNSSHTIRTLILRIMSKPVNFLAMENLLFGTIVMYTVIAHICAQFVLIIPAKIAVLVRMKMKVCVPMFFYREDAILWRCCAIFARSWQYHKRVSSSFYIQGVTSSGTFMPINITNEAKNGRSLFPIPLSPIFSWCGRRRQQFHASHELDPLTNLSRRQKKLSEHTWEGGGRQLPRHATIFCNFIV